MIAVSVRVLPLIACVLACPAVSALEGVSLGVAVESLPTDYDFTIRDGAAVNDGEDSFDLGFGASAGIRLTTPLGVRVTTSFALELAVGAYSDTGGDRYLTTLGRVVLGYAYRADPAWSIGAEGWFGAGAAALDIAGVAGAADAVVDGAVMEVGVRLVGDYVLGRGWSVRGGIGWQGDRAEMEGDGLRVDLEQSGPVALVGLGWSY